jgi:hypothetical protein
VHIARPIWLLAISSFVGSCASLQEQKSPEPGSFEYVDSSGKIATFNIASMTISYPGETIYLTNCSNPEIICLESKEAKIVVPRHCNTSAAFDDYLSMSDDLEFIGNEGLSGNTFKAFRQTDKFGYAYHFENGIVQLVLIPQHVDKKIARDPMSIPTYTYRISRLKGPFPCRAKSARN